MPDHSPRAADFHLLDTFWREPVERQVLPNGLTLIVKPDHSAALASVQVWVKTGSIHEGANLGAGLSHFLEHMLFKGTDRRAGREISATVQAHGGYINAYTTFDRTVYYIDLPSEHVGVAIDLLADATLHSTLPADEVARERDVILREIAMTRDDPDQRLSEGLFDTAFRVHPYRHPIIGHREVFAAVTRDDLVAYYRARYVPNNLVVVIVGAVDPAAVRAEVERHFGGAPRVRLAPVFVPDEPAQLAPRAHHRFEDVELTRAGLAWQIPGLTHPDAPRLDLLATILGAGDSSVLWQAIREKARLVHTIDAHSWNPGSGGLFYVSFTCEADKRQQAAAAIQRELARCATRGFTAAQMAKALRQLVVGEINTRKTMSGQASRLGAAEVVVGDLDYGRSYFEGLRRATAAGLRRVLRTYLVPARLTEVSLNPKAAVAPAVAPPPGAAVPGDFEEIRLPNGARLLLQPDRHLPNLHLRLLCQGGPMFESPAQRGATALLATLLTKDTRRRSAAAVARFIEEVGGSFYPFSGNNSFGLAVEVLPTDFDRALGVLSEAVLMPAFRPATFATEREAQLAELLEDADDVVTLGRKIIRRKFFGDYPLAIDAQGDEAGLRALAPADLAALHRALVVAPNAVLAVAGDFEPRAVLPPLRGFLAKLPKTPLAVPAARFTGPGMVGELVEKQPREQAVVFQAFPGPALLADDFYVGEVADELFSGMASRLFERVREEKGLAYFVRSARVTGLAAALFGFFAGTAPEHAAEVLAEIEAEIARVAGGGVEEIELRRCQTRLKANRRQSLQTNAARAMNAGLNALYGLPVNDWKNYDARVEAVTREALAEFARRYLRREQRMQLIVRP
ncbi:MAG TPA: pitrilysin family protein [Opitutaceae bacterium]|nr:pitrilysin family protein [Opitutaceae bacterium]